jgi:peroxiredoxin
MSPLFKSTKGADMKREVVSAKFPIGTRLPSFSLKSTTGENWSSDSVKIEKGLLVVFTCNHCPYVKGSEGELVRLATEYQSKGIIVVAVNSNDPQQYPDDNFENMQRKSLEMNLPYPYLFDETQEVAKAFDAACTPECYLFDTTRRLVYHGAINDTPKAAATVNKRFLAEALEELCSSGAVSKSFSHPMGCSIKWRN